MRFAQLTWETLFGKGNLDFRAFEENPAVAMLPDGIKPQKLPRTPHVSFVTT
jgi:hypothetical protein